MFEILIDADILLDALLNRVEKTDDPLDVLEVLKFSQIRGYLTDIGFKRIISIICKLGEADTVKTVVSAIESQVIICETTRDFVLSACQIPTSDYESALEIVCAQRFSLGAIVTHRPENFTCNDTVTLSIQELLNRQFLEDFLGKKVLILLGNNSFMQLLKQSLQHRLLQQLEKSRTGALAAPESLSLNGIDISGKNLERKNFAHSRMAYAKLAGSLLHEANFFNAHLFEANLSYANLEQACLERASLTHANLFGANLKYSRAKNANFQYANLTEANLNYATWDNSKLRRADLRRASLKHSFFNDVDFSRARLDNACLLGANLFGSTFQNASMRNANLISTNLKYVDFRGADLTGACFRNSNLEEADLRDAILDHVDFSGTDLTRARLSCPPLIEGA